MKIKSARFYQSVKMQNKERNHAVKDDPRAREKYTLEFKDQLLHIRYEQGDHVIVPFTNIQEMVVDHEESEELWQQTSQTEEKPKRKRGRPAKRNFLRSTESNSPAPF